MVKKALRHAESARARGVAIVDILMPNKDGFEVIMDAKALDPDLKIIAVSDNGTHHTANELLVLARTLGADVCMRKPLKLDHLVDGGRRPVRPAGAKACSCRLSRCGLDPMDRPLVCVVDDDPLYREAICHILQPAGYRTIVAKEGGAGLKEVERSGASVMILDMLMPGKEGFETITEARKRFPQLKVIAISAGGIMEKDDLLALARALGAHACLSKPFRAKELLTALATLDVDQEPPTGA